jgi:hypothetical protein
MRQFFGGGGRGELLLWLIHSERHFNRLHQQSDVRMVSWAPVPAERPSSVPVLLHGPWNRSRLMVYYVCGRGAGLLTHQCFVSSQPVVVTMQCCVTLVNFWQGWKMEDGSSSPANARFGL